MSTLIIPRASGSYYGEVRTNIGGLEVDSQPTSARRQEKNKIFGIRLVVCLNIRFSIFVGGVSIDATVRVTSHDEVILKNCTTKPEIQLLAPTGF